MTYDPADYRQPPHYHETEAKRLEDEGQWFTAAEAWTAAAAASIGHNRSARYEVAAQRCRIHMESLLC